MARKFLITGATGFLGKRLAKEIIDKGYSLSVIIRETSNVSVLGDHLSKITCYNSDVLSIGDIVSTCQPDYVIHCAVAYGRKEAISEVFKTNLNLFIELLNASISSKVLHFINTDTFSGKNGNYDYLQAYHLSKRHAMEWATLMIEESTIKFSNLRLEHIYGPDDNQDKFFPKMVDLLSKKVKKIELTAGLQRRDFVYLDDVVKAYIAVIKNQEAPFVEYQVGTGVSTSIKELLELIKSLIKDCNTDLQFGAIPTRKGEFEESIADISALENLGWHPKVSIKNGINKLLELNQSY